MRRKVIFALITIILIMAASFIGYGYWHEKKFAYADLKLYDDAVQKPLKQSNITLFFMTSDMALQTEEQEHMRQVLDEIEKRTKDTLNIHMEVKFFWYKWDNFIEGIKTALASNQPCDGFGYIAPGLGTGKYGMKSLVDEGLILDISRLLPKYAPLYYSGFTNEEIEASKIENKLYIVPNKSKAVSRRSAIVREDFLEKYNIDDIKSYSDLENYLQTVKENEPNMIPLSISDSSISLFAGEYGYTVVDKKLGALYRTNEPYMKILAWEETSEFKASLDRMYNWYKNGYLGKLTSFGLPDEKSIASGKYGAFIAAQGDEHFFNTILDLKGITDWKYRAFSLNSDSRSSRVNPSDFGLMFTSKTTNAEAILKFIEWLNQSQENYDLFMYGIKGKDYELKGERFTFPKNKKINDLNSIYYFLPYGMFFKNIELERTNVNDTVDFKNDYMELYDEGTNYPAHLGFSLNEANLSQNLLKYLQRRDYSYNTLERAILSNVYDTGKVEEFINSQKAAGLDDAMAEMQKLLDKWNDKGVGEAK